MLTQIILGCGQQIKSHRKINGAIKIKKSILIIKFNENSYKSHSIHFSQPPAQQRAWQRAVRQLFCHLSLHDRWQGVFTTIFPFSRARLFLILWFCGCACASTPLARVPSTSERGNYEECIKIKNTKNEKKIKNKAIWKKLKCSRAACALPELLESLNVNFWLLNKTKGFIWKANMSLSTYICHYCSMFATIKLQFSFFLVFYIFLIYNLCLHILGLRDAEKLCCCRTAVKAFFAT